MQAPILVARLQAVERILRHLKIHRWKGVIFIKHSHLQVKAFTNTNWGGLVDDRHSTTGYYSFVGDMLNQEMINLCQI